MKEYKTFQQENQQHHLCTKQYLKNKYNRHFKLKKMKMCRSSLVKIKKKYMGLFQDVRAYPEISGGV